jgi:hypothetical protein
MSLLSHQANINKNDFFWETNSGITLAYSASGLSGSGSGITNIVSTNLTFATPGRLIIFACGNFINSGGASEKDVTASVSINGDSAGVGVTLMPITASCVRNLGISGGYFVSAGTFPVTFSFAFGGGAVNYSGAGLMILFVPN